MTISANFPALKPSLLLDFANVERLDPRITFTRASNATYFDANGVLQTASSGVARFDHNPTTLQSLGLLIEEQRTNSIRNNTMQGAVAGAIGAGGSVPTNWTVPDAGMTVTVGTATENGISCVDITWNGTATANNSRIAFESSLPAAADGQTWAGSAYLKIVSGSYSQTASLRLTGPGGTLDTTGTTVNLDSTLNRYVTTRTLAGGFSSVQVVLRVGFNVGEAYNFTLRIGLPQLEQGAFATSVIPTTTAAATRNADAASMTGTNFSSWYRADEGTVYSESMVGQIGVGAITAAFSDGTTSNRIQIQRTSGNNFNDFIVSNGTTQSSASVSGVTANVSAKIASAYRVNNFQMAANGTLSTEDTNGTVPVVDRIEFGQRASSFFINGTIKKIAYFPVRLSNAQLQALTR